jgi:hypothetical protein
VYLGRLEAVTIRAAALCIASLLTVAACTKTTAQPAPAPVLPPASTSPAVTSGPATNDRGYIPKTLGQEAGWGATGTSGDNSFTLDKVTVDAKCGLGGSRPASGHTLLIQMRVATGSDPGTASLLAGGFKAEHFQEIGKDGVTRQASDGMCSDFTKRLPGTFGVNQKYVGTIELVVAEASGTLVLVTPDLGPGGWEWRY